MKNAIRNRSSGISGIRLKRALYCSLSGLSAAWREERSFREIIILALILTPIAFLLPLTVIERIILILPLGIGLQIELLNSAIENTVDLATQEMHPLAKKAKDMGSAAQFINLILLAVIWFLILGSNFG